MALLVRRRCGGHTRPAVDNAGTTNPRDVATVVNARVALSSLDKINVGPVQGSAVSQILVLYSPGRR